jgi:hypothetical protein
LTDNPQEQPAVRTTIVGGRPPGSGKAVGNIPRGIEVLVKKAAVDPAFKALLLEKRAGAAESIGLRLDPTEVAMLTSIPEAQLSAIIAGTKVAPGIKKAFLGYAAAVMLAALGCDAGSAGSDEVVTKGIDPDTSYIQPQADNIPKTTGILKGKVADQQGRTLEGAEINVALIWVYIPGTSSTPPSDVPIAGMIYDPGQKESPSRSVEADATTDSDGRFLFSALPTGIYAVSVMYSGFRDWDREVDVTGGTTDITVQMIKEPEHNSKGGARPDIPDSYMVGGGARPDVPETPPPEGQ